MRGNKLEKSHIHILESETLSRESRVTESYKRLSTQSLITADDTPILLVVNTYILFVGGVFYKNVGILLRGCLTVKS